LFPFLLPPQLAATLNGWYGPELVLLAAAVRPVVPTYSEGPALSSLKARKPAAASAAAAAVAAIAAGAAAFKEEQQSLLRPLMSMLQAGLLPRVARGDELAGAPCVLRGQYRSALRALMGDRPLLAVLPVELLRCLCLTYWQQVRLQGRGSWTGALCMRCVPAMLAVSQYVL
jgi:hypothetical protein